MEILSKTDLKQLVGASRGDGGCGATKDTCNPTPDCDTGENNGVCTWVENVHIKACMCLDPNLSIYSYGYYSY